MEIYDWFTDIYGRYNLFRNRVTYTPSIATGIQLILSSFILNQTASQKQRNELRA